MSKSVTIWALVQTQYRHWTDRQTDRRTDGRTDGIGVRMHSMLTRDKNERNTTAAINTTK